MKDETFFEVWIRYPKRSEWMCVFKTKSFKLAKKRYNEFVNRNDGCMVRLVRAEVSRSVKQEELRGNVYDC